MDRGKNEKGWSVVRFSGDLLGRFCSTVFGKDFDGIGRCGLKTNCRRVQLEQIIFRTDCQNTRGKWSKRQRSFESPRFPGLRF